MFVRTFYSLLVFILLWATDLTAVQAAEGSSAEVVQATATAQAAPTGGPEMEIKEPDYVFPTLRAVEVTSITHSFGFKNVGTEDLLITNIKPSCGCTKAIASATTVIPGATAVLEAVLRPKGKGGQQSITVRVTTNEFKDNQHVFKIKGTVLADWRLLPQQATFQDMGPGESKSRLVHLNSMYVPDQTMYRITELQSDAPEIEAVTKEYVYPTEPAKGKGYIDVRRPIEITASAGKEMGKQSGTVTVMTDDEKNPKFTIRVQWTVEGDLKFVPRRATVYEINGKPHTAKVTISSRSGLPFEIVSFEITDKEGKVCEDLRVEPNADSSDTGKIYTIGMNFQSEKRSESRTGYIHFMTTHPDIQDVKVPYTATYRKPTKDK